MLGRAPSACALAVVFAAHQLPPAAAHDVGVTLVGQRVEGPGVAVEFALSIGQRAALTPVQVFAPGEEVPWQDGKTDRLGRVAFLPDRPGPWRVRIEDYMGYSATSTVDVGPDQVTPREPLWRRWLLRGSLLGNVALVVLLFAVLSARRRKPSVVNRHEHAGGHDHGHRHPQDDEPVYRSERTPAAAGDGPR